MPKTIAAHPLGGNLPEFPTPRQYSNSDQDYSDRPPNRSATRTPPGSVRNHQQSQNNGQLHQADSRYSSANPSVRHAPQQGRQQRPSTSNRVPSQQQQQQQPSRPIEHGQAQYDQYQAYSRHPVEQMRNVSIGSNHSIGSHNSAATVQAGARRPVVGIQGRSGRSSPQLPSNVNFAGQAFGIAPENTTRPLPYDRVLWNIFCQVGCSETADSVTG